MSFFKALLRRFFAASSTTRQGPVLLGTDALTSVVGGTGGSADLPKNTW